MLEKIEYNQDNSKKELTRAFDKIENLMPKLDSQERTKAVNMLNEIDYFIDLKERDEDLEARSVF